MRKGVVPVISGRWRMVRKGVGLLLVVVDALAIAPAVGGEVQRHHEPLFAVRRSAGGTRRAVGTHGPREAAEGTGSGVGDLCI